MTYIPRGRLFEEFTVGETITTAARTVTEGVVDRFAGLFVTSTTGPASVLGSLEWTSSSSRPTCGTSSARGRGLFPTGRC